LRGVTIDEIPVIKDQLIITWVEMFYACHNHGLTGLTQWCWPNGKPYLAQPSYLVQIFNLIQQQIAIALKQKSGK